ncbi:hypothetical protein [Actinokineospora sp. HUAS TT18]|uniref:hypothetical protein n=1 Tax=Actinokineospora sp. HUAS TT18 TaxID=3447451 RepID=UPI003F5236E8
MRYGVPYAVEIEERVAHEKTIPLLPCASIDELQTFYEMLGFKKIYYQVRPNPYVSMKREDLQLDFFGMPGFKAEDSYGTCVVLVHDTGELFQAFAEGMRAVTGSCSSPGFRGSRGPANGRTSTTSPASPSSTLGATGSGSSPPKPSPKRT